MKNLNVCNSGKVPITGLITERFTMKYLIGANTDIGVKRKTNQDALTVKVAKYENDEIAFAVLCDGMGGLEHGELASATVISRMSDWFTGEYPLMINKDDVWDDIILDWRRIFEELNQGLVRYGDNVGEKLGTTCVVILIRNGKYVLGNVGDSRIYKISDTITQLTKDQSLIAREIDAGRLTKEDAKKDSRKNVLLQCIGANNNIAPELKKGDIKKGDIILLCSDGFIHEITDYEIEKYLIPDELTSREMIDERITKLIKLNIERQEKDNISAAVIKLI